jgi:4-amino-4-deoxy-L-arabinose transferase-like glycosyltransferase
VVRPLIAVAAGAFVLRLIYALAVAPDIVEFTDDLFYHLTSLQLADGRGYIEGFFVTRPTAAHPPLYPLGLAAIARLGGRSVDAQRILGVCAGTGTVLVVALIGTRLAGRRAGLVAAGLCAVYPAFIAADGALMSETLFGFIVACALLQTLRLLNRRTIAGTVVLGLLIGAAGLTRGEGLLLLPILGLILLFRAPPPRLLPAAALIAATMIVVAPWVARNVHVFGMPVFTTNEGTTLAGANCHRSYYGDAIGSFTITCLAKLPADLNPAEVANERRKAAFRYIRAHRGRAAVVAGLRVLRLWSFYGIDTQTTLEGRDRTVQIAGLVFFYPLLALGIAGGVVLFLREKRRELAVMLAPIVVSTLTAALTYGLPRLRQISDVALLVLAGIAITAAARARSQASDRAFPPGESPAALRA